MPTLPHWNLSQQSRARMGELLQSAASLGLDPDAVAAGGLAALQALIALKRAKDAGDGAGRDAFLIRTQDALRGLDPVAHGNLLQQFQARIMALQGRAGDTDVAHVTPGEIVLPKALQTPAVLGALREAAAAADIPLDQLRVGSSANRINPGTGAAEFAAEGTTEDEATAIGSVAGFLTNAASVYPETARVRAEYADKVHALDPFDNSGRTDLKLEYRPKTPTEMRALIADKPTGPRPGSEGRANVTNATVDKLARWLGRAGKGLGVAGAGVAAYDIGTSDNPTRTTVANAGAAVGGLVGGAAGAALGGPAAPVTGPVGAVGGGHAGYKAGEMLYDFVDKKRR